MGSRLHAKRVIITRVIGYMIIYKLKKKICILGSTRPLLKVRGKFQSYSILRIANTILISIVSGFPFRVGPLGHFLEYNFSDVGASMR